MYSLFIDTHAEEVLMILYKDGNFLNLKSVPSPQNHSTVAMSTLHQLLSEKEVTIKEVNEIIIVIGPGSFTGVRIGVVIAKTLAYTLNVPIKPISTLEMYAVSNKVGFGKLIAFSDKKGCYFSMFNQLNEEMSEPSYLSFEEFDKYIHEKKLERMVLKDDLKINVDEIFAYMKDKTAINPHEINPLYIKNIEVDND